MKGDVGNKTLGTPPQCRLWLTAGAGGANLCQQDTRYRCQVSGPESLLLSSRWSLCAVKCHSKESDRAAPYACWSFHPNLFPLLGPKSSQNIKHKNTQLVVAYSILADSCFHLVLYPSFFFSLSHLCLVIIPRIHCFLHMICQEICYVLRSQDIIFSHSTFCLLLLEQTLVGITASPKRPFGSSVLFRVPTSAHSFEHRLNSLIVYVLESDAGLLANPGEYQNQSKNPILHRKLLRYVLIKLMGV